MAAQNAHELAKAGEGLGKTGIQPYVLHTRTSSVVSIGSFSGPDDPGVQVAAAQLAKWQQEIANSAKDPTKKNPLGLFATPVPVEVPHPDR